MQARVSDWLSAGEYFTFKGYQVFFRRASKPGKPTVLLIHGFPTSSFDFAPIWSDLARTKSIVTADRLGFGFSDKPLPHDYSIIEQADLFESLLSHCKIKEYQILAHDYGVSVAQELLARQVGKKKPVLSVSFLNGGLYPEFHKPLLIQRLMLTRLGPLLAKFFTKKKLRKTFDSIFGEKKASDEDLEAFWQLIEHNDGRRVIPGLLHYMVDRRTYHERWVTAMESTQVPVQMINGPLDPISGAHLAEAFRQRNPHAEVHSLPGVGHYPQVEAPADVTKLYLKFLSRAVSARKKN
jgi:pimeloyl-ACP methyl ester carboxylesterase